MSRHEEVEMPARKDMPSTLKRSPKKAQDTYVKAHDAAVEEYGEGERAHRTALAAVKHSFEKVGEKTAGGVDANASKQHLKDVAKKLDVSGRSKMTKPELVDAIQKANRKATKKSRDK
jgi:cation transport regulator ChaB